MVRIEQAAPESGEILRKMFIGGLSQNTTEDSLISFYQQFGEIVDVVIMRDTATNRSRGFAFVTYKDTASVDRAQSARPHVIDGKTVDSKRALLRTDTPKAATGNSGRKVFVGGLKENHDEQSLREHFQQFGDVLGVKILVDKNTGRKRGFAYVEFEDYDSADKAVLQKNHVIKYLSVDVKKSNYKEERAKRLANQPEGGQNGEQQTATAGVPATGAYPPPAYAPAYGYPPAPGYNGWGATPAAYGQQPPAAPYPTQQPAAPAAYPQQPPTAYPQQPPTAYPQQPPTTYPPQPPASAYPPQQPAAYGPPPTWNGWGYSAPPAAGAPAPAVVPPATNGWNTAAAPAAQSFGNYEQSYNGGPQKGGKLQSNRNNPYRT